jgi:AraC-like DNA-binding protein
MARQAWGSTEPLVDVALGRPGGPAARFVERYVGYRMVGFPPGVHRGLPGRHVTCIISLAEPVESVLHGPGGQGARNRNQAFVSGLALDHALIRHDGNQYGIAIEFGPLATRPLFGIPAGELGGIVVELDELLGPGAATLAERLAGLDGWTDRFTELDRVLAVAIEAGRHQLPHEAALRHAWQRLVEWPGPHRVDELAAELGWSRRHVGGLLRRETGLSPIQLRRVARFERSVSQLAGAARASVAAEGGPSGGAAIERRPTLADVAATSGYYDQAHFNREWRELAGCSPSRWLEEEQLPVLRG